jgi:hypothetical protein
MVQYGSPSSIKILLGKYIIDDGDEDSIHEATKICHRYFKQEPIVILELALLKVACLLNPPLRDGIDFIHYCVCGGWKQYKSNMRHDSMIDIVITNVLPYLGITKDHH